MTDTPWRTTAQAAEYAHCHKVTILRRLEAGELKGHQVKFGGRWLIHRDDLDAWIRGESNVTPIRKSA